MSAIRLAAEGRVLGVCEGLYRFDDPEATGISKAPDRNGCAENLFGIIK